MPLKLMKAWCKEHLLGLRTGPTLTHFVSAQTVNRTSLLNAPSNPTLTAVGRCPSPACQPPQRGFIHRTPRGGTKLCILSPM